MADKIPDSQMLPAGAHAEKKSVHKSDRKKESAVAVFTVDFPETYLWKGKREGGSL